VNGLLASAAVFVVALAVLLASADAFVDAVADVGLALGVSPFVLGATVVAGGTSIPELVAGTLAVARGASPIVVGSVVGSNVANICLVLGLSAVVARRIDVQRELVRVDLPLLIASAVFLAVTTWDGTFAWYEGALGLVGVAVYAHFAVSDRARLEGVAEELVEEHGETDDRPVAGETTTVEATSDAGSLDAWTLVRIAGSLSLVLVAADQLVNAVLGVAASLGVSTALVALTAVSVGSSFPEIAVSVTAVRHGDVELSVGNVLGSNIVNAFAVMGVASLAGPITVPVGVRTYALPVMLLVTVLYYFVTQNRQITRWEGAVVLVLYAAFLLNVHRFV